MIHNGENLQTAARKAGIDPKTARKYINQDNPFEKKERHWRTRDDIFQEIWSEIKEMLIEQPGLEAKSLFLYLQEKFPDRFKEGQLRTFQRKVSHWKAINGESKEVFFEQIHHLGDLCASDFTTMNDLKITIADHPFSHLLYHFVLTYSNWESVTICYAENLESLSEGLQNALWQLGGTPQRHRSDRLSAAIKNLNRAQFTKRYLELLDHYGLKGEKTQPYSPHENGDVEQAHYRLKRSLNQALLLRGSRDFGTLEEYQTFLREFIVKRNISRKIRFAKEAERLRPLPQHRLPAWTEHRVRVSRGSFIRVKQNTYSVPSSLIGKQVEVRLGGNNLSLWYQGEKVEEFPRLVGRNRARIDYRHLIDWLIRKPNAFQHYRYREELFPTTTFRTIYDLLKEQGRDKEYLKILRMCIRNGERMVENVLKALLQFGKIPAIEEIEEQLKHKEKVVSFTEVTVFDIDLSIYDRVLLGGV